MISTSTGINCWDFHAYKLLFILLSTFYETRFDTVEAIIDTSRPKTDTVDFFDSRDLISPKTLSGSWLVSTVETSMPTNFSLSCSLRFMRQLLTRLDQKLTCLVSCPCLLKTLYLAVQSFISKLYSHYGLGG